MGLVSVWGRSPHYPQSCTFVGYPQLPPSFSQELSQYAYFVLNTSSDEYYSTWLMRNALFYYLLETL